MAEQMGVDAVVCLGDLDRAWIESLAGLRLPRLGVHGNHDQPDLLREVEVQDLHGRRTSLGGLTVAGFEGCVRYGTGRPIPPHAEGGRQARAAVARGGRLLLAHCPPFGINDDPDDPAHVGWIGLLEWVDRHRPRHLLHGHTHPVGGRAMTRHRRARTSTGSRVRGSSCSTERSPGWTAPANCDTKASAEPICLLLDELVCSSRRRGGEVRGPRSEVRHPLRADPDRAEDAEEPLLPGAALHRRGVGEARLPGLSPRDEGRGRLGRASAPSTARSTPSPTTRSRVSARIWDDGDVRNLAAMCDRVHQYGALAGIELWYGGPHAPCMESRATPRGPVADPVGLRDQHPPALHGQGRHPRAVQKMYVDAALRARDAGFDIVYVYGAHSYLPLQFLSPFYNKRTDEYGGSLREPRALLEGDARAGARGGRRRLRDRLALRGRHALRPGLDRDRRGRRALRRVRRRPRRPLGPDRRRHRRVGPERGPVALLRGEPREALHRRDQGRRPHQQAGRRRRAHHRTRTRWSRSSTPGQFDIIGAARPSISDPFLPKKIEEGRLDDIRECIGCNQCISRWEIGGPPMVCTQNATAGEEYRRGWHPEKFSKADERRQGRAGRRRRARPAWSARWCSASARCRPCTSSRPTRRSAAA